MYLSGDISNFCALAQRRREYGKHSDRDEEQSAPYRATAHMVNLQTSNETDNTASDNAEPECWHEPGKSNGDEYIECDCREPYIRHGDALQINHFILCQKSVCATLHELPMM